MRRILIYIGLTLILIFVGSWLSQYFFELSISELNLNNVDLVQTSIDGQFNQSLMFGLIIGLIPILYLIVDKIVKIKSKKQSLIILIIIILTGIFSWQLRIIELNISFAKLSQFELGAGISNSYKVENLNFELYLAIGMLIGTSISSFAFRLINKKTN